MSLQVNSDGVCYLVPPLAFFCRKDWLWNIPAEAMSEMQRLLHATSVCPVRCGIRACVKTIEQWQTDGSIAVKSVPGKSNFA